MELLRPQRELQLDRHHFPFAEFSLSCYVERVGRSLQWLITDHEIDILTRRERGSADVAASGIERMVKGACAFRGNGNSRPLAFQPLGNGRFIIQGENVQSAIVNEALRLTQQMRNGLGVPRYYRHPIGGANRREGLRHDIAVYPFRYVRVPTKGARDHCIL